MNDLYDYANIKVDYVNDIYNKLTNDAPCPICKTGVLSFLAADDELLAVTQQKAHYIKQGDTLESVTFPTYTLICTTCGTQQSINANIILDAADTEHTKEVLDASAKGVKNDC
ncbi:MULTISPECIES: hypothetical protein [Pseudoalteromonas]|uniref:hypothetical protein n=1 Tax=Pseudoalteromonas TaxID=53246 RepID=UPI00249B5E7A|nr:MULTISPECIES: hypothetical protein [Pseudoalteromonas]MDI3246912.1 hypothetical protein [Pseudoalteromonas agarivorans]WRU71769.1 hypothetical protein VOI46_09510 [Pseudoalteromonas sp. CuT 4-3]